MADTRQSKWQAERKARNLCRSCGKRKTRKLRFLNGRERQAALCVECYRKRVPTIKLQSDKPIA